MGLDPWGRGHPLGLRTQGRGFDSRWVRSFLIGICPSLEEAEYTHGMISDGLICIETDK
jgi:hypothetical protein